MLIAGAEVYPGSENGLLRVEIFAAFGTELLEGKWEIVLHAHPTQETRWDAWLDHPSLEWDTSTREADVATTITSPGTCKSAITVGAYVHTTLQTAPFSGRGPGRHALQKPDLTACGTNVVCISASTPARYMSLFCGTSAAAPQVSGAAALLFQKFGRRLTGGEVKKHLLQMADSFDNPNPAHGFGRTQLASLPGRAALDEQLGEQNLTDPQSEKSVSSVQTNHKHTGQEPMSIVRISDGIQIIDGLYHLYQNSNLVGKLLVKPGASSNKSTEYWGLYTSYRWPSASNSNQDIVFAYQGVHTTITPLELKQSLPSGSTYIVAECDAETI
ncbi:MAG: S8 family serine peptidase [Polyangiaceae bacterium]|nr:S8 family serine peptidase [Polyangiaceae bacterium]